MAGNDITSTGNIDGMERSCLLYYTASMGGKFQMTGEVIERKSGSGIKRDLCMQVFCKRTRFTGDNSY